MCVFCVYKYPFEVLMYVFDYDKTVLSVVCLPSEGDIICECGEQGNGETGSKRFRASKWCHVNLFTQFIKYTNFEMF